MKKLLLLTVALLVATPVFAQKEDLNFSSIELKCSAENGGLFELVQQNKSGSLGRWRVMFKQGKPAIVSLSARSLHGGGDWKDIFRIDMNQVKKASDEALTADPIIKKADELERDVCRGTPEAKKSYYDELAANKARLRK